MLYETEADMRRRVENKLVDSDTAWEAINRTPSLADNERTYLGDALAGLNDDEIAHKHGIRPETARDQITRAINKVRNDRT